MTYDSSVATGLPARPANVDPKYVQLPYDEATRAPRIFWGTGSPEGVVPGIVGDTYYQTDGANGAMQWFKRSGTGNTGWAEYRATVGGFNVRDFGAVGDGSTDDTVAIQAAIDEIPAGESGVVTLPIGNHIITAPLLSAARRLALVGLGADFNGSRLTWSGSAGAQMLKLGDGSGFIASPLVEGIMFDGANVTPGIDIILGSRPLIYRCRFNNNATSAVQMVSGVALSLCECRFSTQPAGAVGFLLTGPGSGHSIIRNTLQNARTGIRLAASTNGMMIAENNIEENEVGIDVRLVTNGIGSLSIVANALENNSTTPIQIGANGSGDSPSNLRLLGNAIAVAGNGALVFTKCDGFIVEGNSFGPDVTYGSALTNLYLRSNTYVGAKTLSTDSYRDSDAAFDSAAAAYTPSNVTPDRAFDADTVAIAELADVVGTLIADLQARGTIT